MGDSQPRRIEERIARELALVLGMLALALVQVTLLPSPLGFPPPLLLVLVVCRVLVAVASPAPDSGIAKAMRWALYGGVALDVLTSRLAGSHALALLLAATLVAAMTLRLRIEGPLLPLLAVLAGAIAYELTLALLSASRATLPDWRSYVVVVIVPSVLLALIPALPLFALMRWIAMWE